MRIALIAAALALIAAPSAAQDIDPKVAKKIERLLKQVPLVDGHNDLPWALRSNHGSSTMDLHHGTASWHSAPLMTDFARLRAGHVGAQLWSVYIDAETSGDEAIRQTIEQLDMVDRLVEAYPEHLAWAHTAKDIRRIHKKGRIASMAGIEGGHQIGGNLAALRQFYNLGARYMTITHWKTTDWADSATDDPRHGGLAPFGEEVIKEMNRLGMLVDLSHVSEETMNDVLDIAKAPVIFSHSSARGVGSHPRNVPDSILARLKDNGGVVMVTFVPSFLSNEAHMWGAERAAEQARQETLNIGDPDALKAAMDEWDDAHPYPVTTAATVADHIDHIARVAGYDHVGIGGDLDGISRAPEGLGSADGYPLVFAELIKRGWSDRNLKKLAGLNFLRALEQAERVAAELEHIDPVLAHLPPAEDDKY